MLKFLHTADVHLGAKFKYLGEKALEHREQVKKTFSRVVEKAIEDKVDVVLIAGDLFDSNNVTFSIIEFVKNQFGILKEHGIQVCILPGTHDLLSEDSVYRKEKFEDEYSNVYVFIQQGKKEYPEFDVTIWGKPNFYPKSDETPMIAPKNSTTKYNILMAHGSVQIEGKSAKDDYPITFEHIKNSGMNYIALGHWHSLGEYSQGDVKCYYSGSPEMIDIDQKGAGNVLLGTIEDGNARVEPYRVGTTISIKTEIDLGQIEREELLKKYILENSNKNLVKTVELKGLVSPCLLVDAMKLEQELAENFFRLKIINNSHVHIDSIDEKDYPEELVIGRFVRLMKQKIAEASDEAEKKRLEQVLNVGLMELSGKSVI